jgi:hypothetical protein
MHRWPHDDGSTVQYDFSNERVRLSLRIDLNVGKTYFDLDDLTVREAIREEGWVAKPE